jgi:hypothetical protein
MSSPNTTPITAITTGSAPATSTGPAASLAPLAPPVDANQGSDALENAQPPPAAPLALSSQGEGGVEVDRAVLAFRAVHDALADRAFAANALDGVGTPLEGAEQLMLAWSKRAVAALVREIPPGVFFS